MQRSLFLLLAAMLSASMARAQPVCDSVTCTMTGDIFFVGSCSGNVDDSELPTDRVAVQHAFCCVRDGGTVVFPKGATCSHDVEIELKGARDFVIEGNGATLITADWVPVTAGPYGGIRIEDAERFEVRNLTIDGNRDGGMREPGNVANHSLLLRDVRDATVLDVRARNGVADGFHVKGRFTPPGAAEPLPRNRVKLIGCTGENNGRHGLAIVDAEDVQVIGGAFVGNNGLETDEVAGVPFSDGIRIETHINANDERIADVLIQGATLADNAGSGIHVQEAVGQPTEWIRITDSLVRGNGRHALRLRGHQIDVRGNTIADHPPGDPDEPLDAAILIQHRSEGLTLADNTIVGIDRPVLRVRGSRVRIADNRFADLTMSEGGQLGDATVLVDVEPGEPTADVVIEGNSFEDVENGIDLITITSGVERPLVAGNRFRRVNLTTPLVASGFEKPTLIRSDAAATRVIGNDVWSSENRGVHLSGGSIGATIADNRFQGMVGNVLWANGEDTVVHGNRIADALRALDSNLAEDALVRIRRARSTVTDNVVACASGDTSQKGLRIEQPAISIADNVVYDCNQGTWLQQLNGVAQQTTDNERYPPLP